MDLDETIDDGWAEVTASCLIDVAPNKICCLVALVVQGAHYPATRYLPK